MYHPGVKEPDMPSGNAKADRYTLTCADCDWKACGDITFAARSGALHAHQSGHTILYKGRPQVFSGSAAVNFLGRFIAAISAGVVVSAVMNGDARIAGMMFAVSVFFGSLVIQDID